MAAGDDGRLRVGRRRSPLRERATRSGWLLLLGIVAAAVALGFIVHFAGIPGRLTPLVIGGCLALLTAVVSPMEDGPRDEQGAGGQPPPMTESPPQHEQPDYDPAEDPDTDPPATEQTVEEDEDRDQAEGE